MDLREATHDMAITALRQTPAVVRLAVLRDESQFKDEGILHVFGHVSLFFYHFPDLSVALINKKDHLFSNFGDKL